MSIIQELLFFPFALILAEGDQPDMYIEREILLPMKACLVKDGFSSDSCMDGVDREESWST